MAGFAASGNPRSTLRNSFEAWETKLHFTHRRHLNRIRPERRMCSPPGAT